MLAMCRADDPTGEEPGREVAGNSNDVRMLAAWTEIQLVIGSLDEALERLARDTPLPSVLTPIPRLARLA